MTAPGEQPVSTPDESKCLDAVRSLTGQERGPLELHGYRVHRYAEAICRARGAEPDSELLLCAGLLHDIGLVEGASRGGVYVRDGALFARDLLGWPEPRATLLADAIERHHELRDQSARGAEVEAMRKADLVDVLGRGYRAGLPQATIEAAVASFPRDGLYRGIAGLAGRALRERPLTMARIFLR